MSFSKCFDYRVTYCCESWAHQRILEEPEDLWYSIKTRLHSSPPCEQLPPSVSKPLAESLACFFQTKDNFTRTSHCFQIKWSTFIFRFWSASQPTPTLRVYTCHTTGGLKTTSLDVRRIITTRCCPDIFAEIVLWYFLYSHCSFGWFIFHPRYFSIKIQAWWLSNLFSMTCNSNKNVRKLSRI